MKTITIQIGNTDDKLTQKEWSLFVFQVGEAMPNDAKIHFFGGSQNWEMWQNVAWVMTLRDVESEAALKSAVSQIGSKWKQECVAWTEGETQFI